MFAGFGSHSGSEVEGNVVSIVVCITAVWKLQNGSPSLVKEVPDFAIALKVYIQLLLDVLNANNRGEEFLENIGL